jgi:hypothetical protein
MSNTDSKPDRSWQEIVADAATEYSPEKLTELSIELEQVLGQRKKLLHTTTRLDKPSVPKKNHL